MAVVVLLVAAAASAGTGREPIDVSVTAATPERLVLTWRFGEFRHQRVSIDGGEYWQIELPGASRMLQAGAPELPQVCRSVMVPEGAELSVHVVSSESYVLHDVEVAPSRGNLLRSVDPAEQPYVFGPVYQRAADYPGTLVELGRPYVLRDYCGVVVRVYPFQYNPAAHTLRVYTALSVELRNSGPGPLDRPQRRRPQRALSRAFDQLYRRHFINYPRSEVRCPPLGEAGEMLVICHDAWLSNVQPFVDHKNAIGIPTSLIGVSTIGNDPTAIKNYIRSVYDTSDLAFVLLVGDAAEVRTPHVTVGNEVGAADPTYALLDGDDWYPDVLVGRFSAQSGADVDTQVARTISYELLPATNELWYLRAVGIASDEGAGIGDDGEADREHIENIRDDLVAGGFYPVDRIYDPGATDDQVAAAVNAGRGLINYCGHGSVYSWGTTGFDVSDVNALANVNMLPFIVSVACNNGTFDGYTCFAEAWLRATDGGEPSGASAMYASSVGQYWAPPMSAQDEIVDLLVAEAQVTFGGLCFAGSCRMIDDYGYPGFEMFQTWHVFGDPALRVVGWAASPTGLTVSGGNLYASGRKGGPFTPDHVVYTLHNARATPIDYAVSATVDWVDIDPAAGTLPGLGTVDVVVTFNAAAGQLGHGLHEGLLSFVNTSDHDGDSERALYLDVDARTLLHAFTLDSDPGWSCAGQWAFGQPTGGGSHDRDPTAGHTGTNVYGYNLYGDYTDSMPAYDLVTTAIDCSEAGFVELRFWRWLGVESSRWDHAIVDASNDGLHWTRLWENPRSDVSDRAWTQMVLDLSAVADGQPTVYIRWRMGPTDGSVTFPGWNIDDVEIWGVVEDVVGDVDGDGDVDLGDLALLLAAYGKCAGDPGYDPAADLDGSGCIDLADLTLLLSNYGYGR